jgi:hypothetical protein
MDPDPQAEWSLARPCVRGVVLLNRDRSPDGVGRLPEGQEEFVTATVDLVSVAFAERLAHETAMVGDHADVGFTEVSNQPGRALDVGEDEGHGARGQLGHGPESRGDAALLAFAFA